MIYIFCFIWTLIFTYLAEKQLKEKNKTKALLCLPFAILIPSLVAGLRSLDVGRDVAAYVTPAIKNALSMNFADYMKSPINFGDYLENGYRILIYIFAHISSSSNFSMFMLQLLTMIFVMLFAYKKRDKMSMTFVMLIYMLVWYCVSFTFMRQSLAIAIILYSITFFEEKKYIKTLILFLLAISMHMISYVSLVIYGLMFISRSNIGVRKKKLIYFCYFLVLVLGTLFFEPIVYFLTNVVSILPTKYYDYTQFYFPEQSYSQLSELVMKLFCIFSSLFYMRYANKENSKIDITVVLLLLLTDLSSFLISYKIVNASRIGLYFYYIGLFYLIPNIKMIFKNDGKMRFGVSICLIIIMFGSWVWKFPIKNWCEEFPYRSDIINSYFGGGYYYE